MTKRVILVGRRSDLLTLARAQGHHVTGRTDLNRVGELCVLNENIVQPVGVGNLLQGIENHNKDSLNTVSSSNNESFNV